MKLVLKNWLAKWGGDETQPTEHRLAAAASAVLYEIAISDFHVSAEELAVMQQALAKVLSITTEDAASLLEDTAAQVDQNTALHPFTRAINDEFSLEEKQRLMEALWQVAYADGKLDKYEEHYLRKIADLLYLPHSVFIQAKLAAQK